MYGLVARQYLMQFCPDAVFRKCVIELDIAGGKFIAKARFLAEAGWRTLLGSKERDEENEGAPLPVVARTMSCCASAVKWWSARRSRRGRLPTPACCRL